MEEEKDIRAKALLDQLNEIDQRIVGLEGRHLSTKQRVVHASLAGSTVILLALSVSNLERLGINMVFPAMGLIIGIFGTGPLIRRIQTRRLERERDRVLALYQEIDRRAERLGRLG